MTAFAGAKNLSELGLSFVRFVLSSGMSKRLCGIA